VKKAYICILANEVQEYSVMRTYLLSATNGNETCWQYLKPPYAQQPTQNAFHRVDGKC